MLASTLIITACGGGGSSVVTPPAVVTPVTLTFTCWNGLILSNTVQPTKVGCAAVTDSAIKAVVTGSVLSFTGIPTGPALTGSTLVAQGGPSTVTFTNGALVSGTILPTTAYTFTGAKLTFSNAPDLTIAGNFTTAPTAFVWPTDVKTVVEPGIVNGVANQALAIKTWIKATGLPIGANPRDPAWDLELANGNIQILKTGETANDPQGTKQTLWRAVYEQPTGGYCFIPVYSNTGMRQSFISCIGDKLAYIVGVNDMTNPLNNGIIYRGTGTNANNCWRSTVALGDRPVVCPF